MFKEMHKWAELIFRMNASKTITKMLRIELYINFDTKKTISWLYTACLDDMHKWAELIYGQNVWKTLS